jgi:organic radical activating enzyme
MLEVTEVFRSIMGEGAYVGALSIFIRFSRCNLRCHFCDTKYSWGPGRLVEVKELASKVRELLPAELVVFTGGEPLLQNNAELLKLCRTLKKEKILIETNGTIAPEPELINAIDVWSISPKLKNSGQRVEYKRLRWVKKTRDWYFKFVVIEPEKDLPDIKRFVEAHRIPHSAVFLQPANAPRENYLKKARGLAEYCMKNGLKFRVVPQLHVILGVK